jgi:hypothetical protein
VLQLVPLVLVAVLLPGCYILVTEPLSEPDKAEPDKRLLGKWEKWEVGGRSRYEIDCPAVKGNPKGLMRVVQEGKADDPEEVVWFFTTMIDKDSYMTIYVELGRELKSADFRKEGAFKKWNEKEDRYYLICRYVLDGDKLTVDAGSCLAMKELMQAEKIEVSEKFERWRVCKTPPGWLAKYLKKSGPQELYDGTLQVDEYRRPKEPKIKFSK